jgi:CheY-like chemotaxis protein
VSDKVKVLCVGDGDAALSTALVLTRAGCEVWACQGGQDALAEAEGFRPDVCVVDLEMSGMGGEELASRLREQAGDRPLRCVALTRLWAVEGQHCGHKAGFEEHLVKPVEAQRLVEAVLGRAPT